MALSNIAKIFSLAFVSDHVSHPYVIVFNVMLDRKVNKNLPVQYFEDINEAVVLRQQPFDIQMC